MINEIIATEERIEQRDIPSTTQLKPPTNLSPIQDPPNCLTQFFSFHHMTNYSRLLGELNKQNLLKYTPEFQPMFENIYLWERFVELGRDLKFSKEIFGIEKMGFIVMFIVSILSGLTFLVAAYLQFPLADAIFAQEKGTAWTHAGIIIASILLKLFLFNYAENLSNNLSVNVGLHLQNTFVKSLLESSAIGNHQKLKKNYFYDIHLIKELVLFIPYYVCSAVQVIGSVVFIFIPIGVFGLISLGMFFLLLMLEFGIFKYMYKILKEASFLTESRSFFMHENFKNLIKTQYTGLIPSYYNRIKDKRVEEVNKYSVYTSFYALSQVVGDAFPIVTALIMFAIAKDSVDLNLLDTIRMGIYFGMMYIPIRVMLFGSTIIISAIRAFNDIQGSLSPNKLNKQPLHKKTSNIQKGLMVENLGNCYKDDLPENLGESQNRMRSNSNIQSIVFNQNISPQGIKIGKTILITGRLHSQRHLTKYVCELITELHHSKTVGMVTHNAFIITGTLRENITLFGEFYENGYQEALARTGLTTIFNKFQKKDFTVLSPHSVKSIMWLSLKIQLARALYHDVDYLIINRGLTFEEEILVHEIFAIRNTLGRTNILVSQHCNFSGMIDNVIYVRKNGTINPFNDAKEILADRHHQIHSIIKSKNLKNVRRDLKHPKFQNLQSVIAHEDDTVPQPLVTPFTALFLSQKESIVIGIFVLFSILLTVLLRLYILLFVTDSINDPNFFSRALWPSLLYFLLIVIRGAVVMLYFRKNSIEISIRLVKKLYSLTVTKIHRLYNRQKTTNMDIYMDNLLNENIFRDFEAGFFLLFEILTLIGVSIGKAYLMVTVTIPAIGSISIIIIIYLVTITNLAILKEQSMNSFNLFISDIIDYGRKILGYKKQAQFFTKFTRENRWNVIFDINDYWAISGQRILSQLIILLIFLIVVIVLIEANASNIIYKGFVITSLALLIESSNIIRYILKLNRHFQFQLIGMAQVLRIIKDQPIPESEPDNEDYVNRYGDDLLAIRGNDVRRILFKNVTIQIAEFDLCRNADLEVLAGDRLLINGDITVAKEAIFGILKHIYDKKRITGTALVNDTPYDKCDLKDFNIIHSSPILPKNVSVFEAMTYFSADAQKLTSDQLNDYIRNLFVIIDEPNRSFDSSTPINDLSEAEKELLDFVGQTMVKKCSILILANAFLHLDRLTLMKLLDFITSSKLMNIVVHVSNYPDLVKFYRKKVTFQKGTFVEFIEMIS